MLKLVCLSILSISFLLACVNANRYDVPYWVYRGCYSEAEAEKVYELPYMTIVTCQKLCSQEYRYSALQNNKCLCGNKIIGKKVDNKRYEICQNNSPNYAVFLNPQYLGCFMDIDENDMRDLELVKSDYEKMTVEMCIDTCKAAGKKYAGTQYYGQCFCGDSYGRWGEAPDSKCDMVCMGNYMQKCGGSHANSIYRID